MLECKVCGRQFVKNNIISHIKHKHNITGEEYKSQYNSPVLIQSDETKMKLSNAVKNNSYYSVQYWINKGMTEEDATIHIHELGKKNSMRRIEYWVAKGYTESEARDKVKSLQSSVGKLQRSSKHKWIAEGYSQEDATKIASEHLQQKSTFHIRYWMDRHGMTEDEAKGRISSIQKDLSSRSSKFLGKKRTEESKQKISEPIKTLIKKIGVDNWISHFGDFDNGRSFLEEEIFQYVKTKNCSAKHNLMIGRYNVDIVVENKLIEVFGDYWHANPLLYEEADTIIYPGDARILVSDKWNSDRIRLEYLKTVGYDVLVVWESDWRKNLEKTQQTILDFLYDIK